MKRLEWEVIDPIFRDWLQPCFFVTGIESFLGRNRSLDAFNGIMQGLIDVSLQVWNIAEE